MGSASFTVDDAVMNELASSSTIFFFSKLTDHGEKKHKRHGLVFEKLQRVKDEWNYLVSSIKGCVKGMKQEQTSRILMRQCFSTIEYLQIK